MQKKTLYLSEAITCGVGIHQFYLGYGSAMVRSNLSRRNHATQRIDLNINKRRTSAIENTDLFKQF